MTENKKLVAALTRRLDEKEKEYVELEERYSALLDACESLEKQLDTKNKLSKIGEWIANNERPILITGVEIGDADSWVLSQGRVYSLYYGGLSTRKKLYFAPKAYYPAERLLECYFVIGASGGRSTQKFIPTCIHQFQHYNSLEDPFPDWALNRDCMLPLDFDYMHIIPFHRDDEVDEIKAIVKQINPYCRWCATVIPGMRGSYSLRLIIPDYEHLKKRLPRMRNTDQPTIQNARISGDNNKSDDATEV